MIYRGNLGGGSTCSSYQISERGYRYHDYQEVEYIMMMMTVIRD